MMNRLSSEHILKEHQTRDPNSITSLALTHKALSDVSCLGDFKNLERLDLSFNNLSSLEGLKSCVNLKWLSVVQNKLQSLKGIEGLSNLTVFNAGKNKLKSMDGVQSLVGLRALILNDNEIVSMCKLDQMKDLNTLGTDSFLSFSYFKSSALMFELAISGAMLLPTSARYANVLSRNPICGIGESLLKVKSISKLSLSNCQIQMVGSSLKFCIELKELRLAHNDIKTLPDELAYNKKLQNLDLGNNLITRWSDLKVLGSLVGLKNLNLQGNPIAENDKLTKKVRKLLPNLHVFNAKPISKNSKNEKGDIVDEDKQGELSNEKNSKHHVTSLNKDGYLNDSRDIDMEKELKRKRKKTKDKLLMEEVQLNDNNKRAEKKQKKRSKEDQSELDVIDDTETSFQELFSSKSAENPRIYDKSKAVEGARQNMNLVGTLVTSSAKKKKSKNHGMTSTLQLSQEVEVGMGGSSTWGDE
ncbi:hypothetical protein EZV62_002140 [Acer yangbiense]|uniref:U2A'/phosphoprotein 32 family A C-terminal domain-containing protein n=1 Tax=Acer yangbiense TaxID=1000413 RepID=A0A5C7IW92_9ROSI|nr:hypothetical protein EZV62_002140 [Acer yangbiense]